MPPVGRASLAGGVAALGHGMVFVGFLQPWVAGQFGARDRLSGLDLARVTDGLIDHGLAGDALALPITRVLLFAVPIAAANALVLLALARTGVIGRSHARRLALALAVPGALVALVAHVLLMLAATTENGVVNGPAFGLFVVTAGAAIATGASLLERTPGRPQPPRSPEAPASAADCAVPEA